LIPYVTLSTSSTNISNSDFEKNLSQFIKILTEQYIDKQEKVRKEIENKQRYLSDFQKTQLNENKQLNEKFQQIQKQFQILTQQYQQVKLIVIFLYFFLILIFKKECSRRKRLSTHVDDLLSVIEQSTPVLSDAEIRMQQQLDRYQTQINYLQEKIQLLQQFISSNQNQEKSENLSMKNIQNYVQNHRNQIDQMKKRLQTIQIHK
jgi:chromosome segregation ATPase